MDKIISFGPKNTQLNDIREIANRLRINENDLRYC